MVALGKVFTAEGSPNIAFIKYWGKRDEKLVLPYNSSISMTFDHAVLKTTTSVMFSKKLKADVFYLDGKLQDLRDKELKERMNVLDLLRKSAGTDVHALIVSKNDFPTASGMASSASGIATLVYTANKALEASLAPKELSTIARQGSGSACRSMFGGIVLWRKGQKADGSDSYAEQAFDENYWPELVDNIVVVSQSKKKVSSRAGMRQTIETNPLFKSRPEAAEKRLREFIDAYRNRNLDSISRIMIADNNEMHALMLSTVPSIRYLNPASYAIMDAIDELNASSSEAVAGYTFDAGPNANIITTDKNQQKVMSAIKQLIEDGTIQYIKTSKAGKGPSMLNDKDSLITDRMKKDHGA